MTKGSGSSSGGAGVASRERRLIEMLRTDERIMTLLRAVRSLGLAEWCIAAGTIRNKVWDELHSLVEPTLPSDVDVLIFDPVRTDPAHEHECEARLSSIVPGIRWEVVNQATIHSYTGDPAPYSSIAEAMSRWADPVTAVGAHLSPDDEITIIAPAGLDDLFELRVRPNLATPTSAAVYRQRVASKRWQERWPNLTIEHLPPEPEHDEPASNP